MYAPQLTGQRSRTTPAQLGLVAEAIGPAATEPRVAELISTATELGFLFHGLKRSCNLAGVRRSGILPLTAEEGRSSYWAAGSQLFYNVPPTPGTAMWSFNSAFFHYGQLWNPDGDTALMAIAVTDATRIHAAGGQIVSQTINGECRVDSAVPPEFMTLVTAEATDPQTVRGLMFGALLNGAQTRSLAISGQQHFTESGLGLQAGGQA